MFELQVKKMIDCIPLKGIIVKSIAISGKTQKERAGKSLKIHPQLPLSQGAQSQPGLAHYSVYFVSMLSFIKER